MNNAQNVAGVVEFYHTHPINEDEILAKLRAGGANIDAITQQDMGELDQDHYGGIDAVAALADALSPRPDDRLLDVCSGMGGPARWIAWKYGCRVTGLDLTPSRIEGATRLTRRVGLQHKVDFRQGDATAMPFEDDAFDMAYSQEAWCHIADKHAVLAECARVLKTRGRLGFTDIVVTGKLQDEDLRMLEQGMRMPAHPTRLQYESMLGETGFSVGSVVDLSNDWRRILVARLEMYRSLRDTTVAKFGEERYLEYDRVYAHFVRLFVDGKLGGVRVIADRQS